MSVRTGVLVTNLGTPAAPTTRAVRTYLREFLGDPRVVEVNRVLWWCLLEGVILPFRAPRSAHAYASIWTAEGSPLLVHGREVESGLRAALGPSFDVVLAMRYGEPSIARGLDELVGRGCERIVLLPLFPQYSASTSGSVYAETFAQIARRRAQPALSVVAPYFDAPAYVSALAAVARASFDAREVDHWILSFHGLPERYVRNGDPYREQCEATARALAAELALPEGRWTLAFQSRFGREPWLQPYTDVVALELASRAPRVAVLAPGFAADCLETLEELGIRLAEDFAAAGGGSLRVAPCLNEAPEWIACLADLVRRTAAR